MSDQEKYFEWLASQRFKEGNSTAEEISLGDIACHASHPEVVDKVYYTLPVDLLNAILAALKPESGLSEVIHKEIRLASPRVFRSDHVGYWQRTNVLYQGFRLQLIRLLSETETLQTWPELKERGIRRLYITEDAQATISRNFRSYLGWLLTNKLFLQEHDELLSRNLKAIRRWGIEHDAHMPEAEVINSDESPNPQKDPSFLHYSSEKQEFFKRWRLSSLAGPYLPIPLGIGGSPHISRDKTREMTDIGTLLFVPDTIPIPSRDELRELLNKARRELPKAEHLYEWHKIIRSDNAARNQLDRFCRIFDLQHYWRALFERHQYKLKGKVGALEIAFANWFEVSRETVHRDLIMIRRRLGKTWFERSWPP